jgi:hypothetical protein
MRMEYQTFNEHPGEERFYRPKQTRPFWRRYLWQMIAIVALCLAVLFAYLLWQTSHPVPKVQTDGIWSGQFTYYPGEPYSGSFQATLQIPSHQNGVIVGTLSEPVYGNSIVSVSGIAGPSNLFAQNQLQYVTQLYGNGTGVFMTFTDPSYTQGDQIQLNCTYVAVIYPDGSLRGVWFYPGNTQPDGTFILYKVS